MSSFRSRLKHSQEPVQGGDARVLPLFNRAVDPWPSQPAPEISKPPFDTLNPPEICNVPTSSYAKRRYNILFSAGDEEDPELKGRFILGMN
jgi:hypothetical protein